jgi:PKD repeat protein
MRDTLVRLCAALTLVLCAGASVSAATTIYGPSSYAIQPGPPQSFSATFTPSPADACGGQLAYFLVISNADGGVKSATISVNGSAVLAERDFPLSAVQEIPFMPLAGANTLVVVLKGGKQGSVLQIAVERRVEETVLNPSTITIDHGKTTSNLTFSVTAPVSVYMLLLKNGSKGVTHATVALNGAAMSGTDVGGAGSVVARRIAVVGGANSLSVAVSGEPGSSVDVSVQRELDGNCLPKVSIDNPAPGANVTTRRILVTGTASGSRDLGVSVNGAPAQFDLASAGTDADPLRWFVSLDPPPGPVSIVATATNVAGGSATATRAVTYAPAAETILLRPSVDSGAVPLTVNFDFSSTIQGPISTYEFDLDGDGSYERSFSTSPTDLAVTFTTAGQRAASARVTTADGRVFTTTALVIAQSFNTADQTIRRSWTRFTDALSRGDAAGAASQLSGPESKAKYGPALSALGAGLAGFASKIQEIHPIWISGNGAHYLLVKAEPGGTFGYHVYFLRAADGVWRVQQF